MSTFLSAWTIILKRSVAHWRLVSAIALGVVLAVAISSSTVLYFQALRGLGLERDLTVIPPQDRGIQLRMEMNKASLTEYREVQRTVGFALRETLGWLIVETVRSARSSTFYAHRPDEEPPPVDDRLRGSFSFITAPEEHVRIVQGHMPQEITATSLATPVIDGALSTQAAELFDVSLGEEFIFTPFWMDQTESVRVRVVGFFEPVHRDDQLWEEGPLRLTRQFSLLNALPLLIPEGTYFQALARLFPNANTSVGWTLRADVSRLGPANTQEALNALRTLEATLGPRYLNFRMQTPLREALETYQTKLFFMRVPLMVVTLMVVAVVLYYLVLLANLLLERQRGETVLIQSRGASYRQIILMHAMEAILISGLGLLMGPPLAAGTIALLGLTPAFSALSEGDLLPVALSPEAYQMALVGAGLAFITLLLPAFRAARLGAVAYRQEVTRPTQQPFFQRYYLDIGLLALTAFLLWQLESQETLIVTEVILGENTVNQLLLLTPSLFLIAASFLILRLFPLALTALGRLIGAFAPVWSMLGLWELGRNPAHYSRLVLLLMLAAGLGVFAASFGGTLERSYTERALYTAGSDIRVVGADVSAAWPQEQRIADLYASVEGVERVAPVLRDRGTARSQSFGTPYTLVAVDHTTFGDVAWHRNDFATPSQEGLMAILGQETPDLGMPLPGESARLTLWAQPIGVDPSTSLWLQTRDSKGRYFSYEVASLDFDQWQLLEVDLSSPSRRFLVRNAAQPVPTPPFRLMSLYIIQERRQGGLAPGAILLDDITAHTHGGEELMVEDFEGPLRWGAMQTSTQAIHDQVDTSDVTQRGEGNSGIFVWREGSAVTERGMTPGLDRTPLPALASTSFLVSTGYSVGEEVRVTAEGTEIVALIHEVVEFFPTLDPLREDFLIMPLEPVLARINTSRPIFEVHPTEFWIEASPGVDHVALASRLQDDPFQARSVVDRAALLAEAKADPLVAAGWEALLLMAYLSVLFLSIVGFIIHAYVSAQKRRLSFAALRGMGLSVPQLIGIVWFEHVLIIAMGLAFGTWLGGRIGDALLPFLTHTEQGTRVLPPYIIETNWSAVGLTYLGMGLVFAVTVAVIIWVFARLAISRALRFTEV